jgi:hypothetical protein
LLALRGSNGDVNWTATKAISCWCAIANKDGSRSPGKWPSALTCTVWSLRDGGKPHISAIRVVRIVDIKADGWAS